MREYFVRTGKSPHADARAMLQSVIAVTVAFGGWALALSPGTPPWARPAFAILAGIGLAGIAFSVAHDALHGAWSASPRVNRRLGLAFEALGVNAYLWRFTHNGMHHAFTNVAGWDDDVSMEPLLRLNPDQRRRSFHRFQHVYAWALYAGITLYWALWKDWKDFRARRLGPFRGRHPAREAIGLVLGKAFWLSWTLVLPLLLLPLPWTEVVLASLVMQATAGLILGVVLFPAHVVLETEHPSASPEFPDSFARHQMRTTTDYARGNAFANWYLGGCNHQVEHHLFPGVCHVHYPALSRIVEATARRHGVPYHSAPSWRSALLSHARTLRRLGTRDATASGAALRGKKEAAAARAAASSLELRTSRDRADGPVRGPVAEPLRRVAAKRPAEDMMRGRPPEHCADETRRGGGRWGRRLFGRSTDD